MRRGDKRLAVLMGGAVLFLAALFFRLSYVQVIASPPLQQRAADQHVRLVELAAPRGTIYDRNGDPLAVSQSTASVYANPQQIKPDDLERTAKSLAPVIGLSAETVLAKLRTDLGFRYLVRRVDLEVGEKVKQLNLPGIGVLTEPKRVYPKGALAPQLLGWVGGDRYQGEAGIELQYDKQLAGSPGEMRIVTDRQGKRRLQTEVTEEVHPGADLTLTIDAQLQFEVERALTEVVDKYQAKRAAAIVMDPKSGELLALAVTPVIDANKWGTLGGQDERRKNWAVTDQYEPGSTFKVVVVAAALEEGLVTPDTVFTLPNKLMVYGKPLGEAEDDVPEVRRLTVTQILAQSSNIGAALLGKEVGKQRLVAMIHRFGFMQKLGLDFPGEAKGQMLPPEKWNGLTIYNVPMGQAVSVTPLQLAGAYAAIANDGLLVQPHLDKDKTGVWTRRVMSAEVAAQLREMLRTTVEAGTGRQARVQGYVVAGKTGTAQKPEKGGYSHDKVYASFVGMVPVEDPRLVILVVVDEPTTERSGAKVAAPVFAKIADFALRRLGIAPTLAPTP